MFNSGFSRSRYKHMAAYEKFLNDKCGISFGWYICKDSKKLKWRDLTEPEKVKLLNLIDITELLPISGKSCVIQEIWNGCNSIMKNLKQLTDEKEKLKLFNIQVRQWATRFLSVYQSKHVTPYMHALISHVSELVSLHGNIVAFTQQGLEKLNDTTTKNYFEATIITETPKHYKEQQDGTLRRLWLCVGEKELFLQ